MSKKNLARTAIEGGRVSSIRVDERFTTRSERMQARAAMNEIKKDLERGDDFVVKRREGSYREFADKLSPVYRWLEKQVGRHWNDVHSEIKKKFPTRTLAGRHIMGHIEGFLSFEWHDNSGKANLMVGEDGILRSFGGRRYRYYQHQLPRQAVDLSAVLNWILSSGLHGQLNQYMKEHHNSWEPRRVAYLPGFYENRLVPSELKPRVLAGKHDIADFLRDIKRGWSGKREPKYNERHSEWGRNLAAFIHKVRPGILNPRIDSVAFVYTV